MSVDMQALLIAGILGLVVGCLASIITRVRAPFLYSTSGILGAFIASYPLKGIGPIALVIETLVAAIGALGLVFLISRTL